MEQTLETKYRPDISLGLLILGIVPYFFTARIDDVYHFDLEPVGGGGSEIKAEASPPTPTSPPTPSSPPAGVNPLSGVQTKTENSPPPKPQGNN